MSHIFTKTYKRKSSTDLFKLSPFFSFFNVDFISSTFWLSKCTTMAFTLLAFYGGL
jgi:hypothetical protein